MTRKNLVSLPILENHLEKMAKKLVNEPTYSDQNLIERLEFRGMDIGGVYEVTRYVHDEDKGKTYTRDFKGIVFHLGYNESLELLRNLDFKDKQIARKHALLSKLMDYHNITEDDYYDTISCALNSCENDACPGTDIPDTFTEFNPYEVDSFLEGFD